MYINSGIYLQRSQVGLDLKNLIDLGGFCKIARHRTNLMVTGKGKGLDAKQPGLSSSFGQERAGRERRPCPAKSPVTRRPRSAGETLNGERRTRGSRICAHRRRGWKGVAGFRRGGTGGICGRRRSGTRLASGIGGGDVARRRRLHGGLSFLRSAPWPAERGLPAAVVLGPGELRG
jgi:hypothetical protein